MYIALELQTNEAGETGNLVYAYPTQAEAESKYYAILSAAAISKIYLHTAYLLTSDGYMLASKCFQHNAPEPNEEEESSIE